MMSKQKLFSFAVLAILMAVPQVGLSEKRHADEEAEPTTKKSESRRSAKDTEMTETSIQKIDEIFPATKSRSNAEFFKVKKENGKLLADALNDSRENDEGSLAARVEREKATAQHIAMLMNTLGKDNFKEQWEKAKEFAAPFDKPSDSVTQEEALAQRIKIAFEFWGEAKGNFVPPSAEDPLYPFYVAFRGEGKDPKNGAKQWAEKLKKDQWDALKTASDPSKSEDERAAARKKLLGDPNADINDKANRISIGKDALKNLSSYSKEVQAMLPKALSQKVGDGWAIAINGKDGKAAWAEIPKDAAAFQKAFADGAIKNWDVVGDQIDENAKKLAWNAGKWGPKGAEKAKPVDAGTGAQKAVAAGAASASPTAGGNAGSADISFTSSKRCQECHTTTVSGNSISIKKGTVEKTATTADFTSQGPMKDLLTADQKSAIKAFFGGNI